MYCVYLHLVCYLNNIIIIWIFFFSYCVDLSSLFVVDKVQRFLKGCDEDGQVR